MQAAIAHSIMLVFAIGVARLGWFMAHCPGRAYRIFTFGAKAPFGERFAIVWCKIVGWAFAAGSSFGIVLSLILIPLDILRSR
jgi:cytochrome b561